MEALMGSSGSPSPLGLPITPTPLHPSGNQSSSEAPLFPAPRIRVHLCIPTEIDQRNPTLIICSSLWKRING